jgi:hypothetical protein
VILRLAGLLLVGVLALVPVTVLPAAPITWLAGVVLVVGGVGMLARSTRVVTTAASVAVIAYALALVIDRPSVDPAAAIAFGATLVLVLALVHFAECVHGASVPPGVVAGQVQRWLGVAALGAAGATGLTLGAALLAPGLTGARLPVVTAAAALGAILTLAGLVRSMLPR